MQVKKHFIRKVENYFCEHCGTKVSGTGYTNHCPKCLWSKHVDDKIPGDRLSKCQGLMEPIKVEFLHGKYSLLHRCEKCGKISKNKIDLKDNFEKVIELSKNNM